MSAIYVLGASGHGREVAAVVRSGVKDVRPNSGPLLHQLAAFLDDDHEDQGKTVNGVPVLGPLSAFPTPDATAGAALGVGYPESKARVAARMSDVVREWPNLIDRGASVAGPISLGKGCFVQAGAVLTANLEIGDFVTMNVGATVSHDCKLGSYVTLSPGASLGGAVDIGEGAFIGIGASVIQGVTIGPWSVVGAGAAVVRDVPRNSVVAGVPAQVIQTKPDGWQLA